MFENAKFLSKYEIRKSNVFGAVRPKCTHTSFANGSYHVPFEQRVTFMQEYCHEFNKWIGEYSADESTAPTLFINERYNDEYFCFFIDIDFSWDEQPPSIVSIMHELVSIISILINGITEETFDDLTFTPFVAARTSHKLHFVFKNIIVSRLKAKMLGEAINDWMEQSVLGISIDLQPYQNGSLRMIGSCKKSGMEATNEKETQLYYWPVDLNNYTTVSTDQHARILTLDVLNNFSIVLTSALHQKIEQFVDGVDDGNIVLREDVDGIKLPLFVLDKFHGFSSDDTLGASAGQHLQIGSKYTVSSSVPFESDLFQFIKETYGEIYAQAADNVMYSEWNETIYVTLKTRRCPFISDREHTSNHPYLLIGRAGACIKCHSKGNAKCANDTYKRVKFGDLPTAIKSQFWEACLHSAAKYIPDDILSSAKHACQKNMQYWGYHDVSGNVLDVNAVKGALESFKKHSHVSCTCGKTDMILRTTRNGLYQVCNDCSTQYPSGTSGFKMDGCNEKWDDYFMLLESIKNRGMQVLKDVLSTDDCNVPLVQTPTSTGTNVSSVNKSNLDSNMKQASLRDDIKLFVDDNLRIFDDDELNGAFILSLTCTDQAVAKFIEYFICDDFISTKDDGTEWFVFDAPRWRENDARFKLFYIISDLQKYYNMALSWYANPLRFMEGREQKAERTSIIIKTMNRLGDINFVRKVMQRLANSPKLFKKDFRGTLNNNRNLLGFNDGVYDFSTYTFRQGTREDLMSMTVGYNFPVTKDDNICQQIERFFEEIQPEEENRRYLKKFLASLPDGSTTFELFHILTGITRNGKTVLSDMIGATLGCHELALEGQDLATDTYALAYETSFLTKDRKMSSDPAPDILACRYARALYGLEPESQETINAGWMKKITGDDTLNARYLNSNVMVHFKPVFKLILICNDIPAMSGNDQAVWNRSRVIDFPITFVYNPKEANERLINPELKSVVRQSLTWRINFMWLLIEWHKTLLAPEGLNPPPPSVLRATRLYQEESNLLLQWWNERTEFDAKKHSASRSLCEDFKLWSGSKMTVADFNRDIKKIPSCVFSKSVRTEGSTHVGVKNRVLKTYGDLAGNDVDMMDVSEY